uniref:RNase H type-1 domain-containing protein n=1 Tax=Nelumbo nucifera TaxID=4432 RepID=A0A822Z634_NELNU|nr:TPA_asm: hypothetical protein HUJ06_014620 [Nelumbo nucifera]
MTKERTLISQQGWQPSSPMTNTTRNVSFWKAPDRDVIKINTNGSFIVASKAGFGVIARDCTGKVITANYGSSRVQSTIQAEVVTILKGLELLPFLSASRFILEIDYTILIVAISSGKFSLAHDAQFLVQDIVNLTRNRNISFSFQNREGNGVAHMLAKERSIEFKFVIVCLSKVDPRPGKLRLI